MSRTRRSKRAGVLALAVVAGIVLVAGCRGRAEQPPTAQYISPSETLSLPQLIAALNDRSEKIESLHLQGGGEAESGGFEARIREGRDRPERFFNGEITAMYLAPNRLRLIGNKDLAGRVFDLGTDGERFWMHLPTENQLIYGTFEGLDPERASQFPIRPDLVLEVLGVAPMETDLTRAPVPMLRWNPDPQAKAYMLTWAEPVEGPPARWRIVKEVWYDFDTLLPTLVVLFDPDGDPVVRAYLSNHRPVGDEPDAPMIAGYYDLYFPETGSRMWLDFGKLRFSHRRFPRESSFAPPNPGDVPDAQNLDAPSARQED